MIEKLYTTSEFEIGKMYQSTLEKNSCEFLFECSVPYAKGNKATMFDYYENHFFVLEKQKYIYKYLYKILIPTGRIGWIEFSRSRRIFKMVATDI
jgi:N-acetylmuramoyl-L-alanine amidase CwlA